MPFEFEIIRSISDLSACADDWNRLARQCGSPLLSFEWFATAAQSYHRDGSLRVVVARRDGETAAIAPLSERAGPQGRRLELIGMSALHEPSDLLYADEEALLALSRRLVELKMPLVLQRLPGGGASASALTRALRRRGFVVTRRTNGSRFVPVQGTWQDYLAGLSSKRRYDLRRARKRSGGSEQIALRIEHPEPRQVPELLDLALRIEAASWKGRRGSALRDDSRMRGFFERYLSACASRGTLQMSFLHIAGAPCAMQIAIEAARRIWVLKIGYDESYARCSPGIQLMMGVLQDTFERGLAGYELLGSDEPWIRPWAPGSHEYCALIGYPWSLRGVSAVAADAARYAGNKLLRRMQPQHGLVKQ